MAVLQDLRSRAPLYFSEWRAGAHPRVAAATAFLFFACLAPAVAFGGLMAVMTDGSIGAIEMMIATAACGVVYAVVAGQPLIILGGTGPLLVFTGVLYEACKTWGVPFLPTYAWVGLWAGAFVVLLAVTGASRFVSYFTRFTDEIFAALISLIFVFEALRDIVRSFPDRKIPDDAALLGLVLSIATYTVATTLSRLRRGRYLRRWLREGLADFGPALAVIVMVAARYLLPSVELKHLAVPQTFAPTAERPWLIDIMNVPGWVPWAAAVPALLAAVLVFVDQNVTVRVVQAQGKGAAGPAAYSLDLLVVGILLAVCSVFGMPWLVAATVRSLTHTRALAGSPSEGEGIDLRVNRISPLLVHALIGVSLLFTGMLRSIPMAVLFGLFLYMGIASMSGNHFFERLRLWLTDPKLYPDSHYVRHVRPWVIHAFTAVQLAALALLWVVKSSRVAFLFPLFILLLVPLRLVLARFFDKKDLARLDGEEHVEDLNESLGP